MRIIRKLLFFIYVLIIILALSFGSIYLLRTEFMPYHAAAVGKSWTEIGTGFQYLILGLMKIAGAGWLTTAAAMIFLLFIPFRKNEKWAQWALPLTGLIITISTYLATLMVKLNTPGEPPLLLALTGVLLAFSGLILTVFINIRK